MREVPEEVNPIFCTSIEGQTCRFSDVVYV